MGINVGNNVGNKIVGTDDPSSSDSRFIWILKNTVGDNCEKGVRDAAIGLIAYSFEPCDIFEVPGVEI